MNFKKLIFAFLSLLSIIGYGVFVFAAPPGPGGYNPGEILDPECTPGQLLPEPCIVQLLSGSSSGWSLSGNTVPGGVSASIDTVFNGVGLNDITMTGLFTGGAPATWVIVITATGTPDQMEVIIDGDSEYVGDVFPPGPLPVDDGLTLNFGSDTGHTVGDSWEFTMTPASGGTTAFLGTLNNEDLIFKTNNTERMRLLSNGDISLVQYQSSRDDSGTYSPSNFLYTDSDGNLMSAPTSILGGGSFSLTSQDEGSTLTTTTNTFNFTGAGVTATNSGGGLITIDIPGGGSELTLQTNSVTNANQALLNLIAGTNISLADDGSGNVTINASGGGGGSDGSIYLNDGTLTGNRTLNGGGFDLLISNTSKFGALAQKIDSIDGQFRYGGLNLNPGVSTEVIDGVSLFEFNTDTGLFSSIIVDDTKGLGFSLNNTVGTSNPDYWFPVNDGIANQVLSTDGLGQLNWATIATSPITVQNSTSLFSTGLSGTGDSSLAVGANFIGASAGYQATNADYSNFIGYSAGGSATNASESNFIGHEAGQDASAANYSNFLGYAAGSGATNASQSNFFGNNSGQDAINASQSNFLGGSAGTNADNATRSNFLGLESGRSATDAHNSNFLGYRSGYQATSANNSNFLGSEAGFNATSASNANFFGAGAGYQATSANNSNFLGFAAGLNATSASNSNFFGSGAGQDAANAGISNFLGLNAGRLATNATFANFLGANAGYGATNASNSNFLGQNAGQDAINAAKSIFIGQSAGYLDTVNNTTELFDFSILIGHYTSTGGFSNSIAIGSHATNTASSQLMIGSTTRFIDETKIIGSSGTECTITTGTGMACTSDERLKTNITDLNSDTLSKLQNIRTVSYNWLQNPNSSTQIGFLAQNLEQYFPEMVMTDASGKKQVYYSQMTPILVEAIREMNLNVTQITDMTQDNTWRDALIAWFGNATNGIENFIAGTIRARNQVCIDDVCINKEQLQSIMQNNGIVSQPSPIISTPPPTDDSIVNNTTDDTAIDPNTDTNVPGEEPSVSTDDTNSPENTEPSTTE